MNGYRKGRKLGNVQGQKIKQITNQRSTILRKIINCNVFVPLPSLSRDLINTQPIGKMLNNYLWLEIIVYWEFPKLEVAAINYMFLICSLLFKRIPNSSSLLLAPDQVQ